MIHKNKFEERARYWREIIARADEHPVSCHAFCVEEGISQASFYSWRNKLSKVSNPINFKPPRRLPSVFTKIKVEEQPYLPPAAQRWPIDSKWLADFVLHLHVGAR